MKFRDGMWLPAADKRLEYAEEVYSITEREDGKALSLLCPTRKVLARFDSLNLSTLTVVCSCTVRHALVVDFLRRI
jgi:alpha-D-xyloside xylohydrolase